MIVQATNLISATEAQETAKRVLPSFMATHYRALPPEWEATTKVWRLPVVLTYGPLGSIGEVGEIKVSASTGKIISHTPLENMLENGRRLYEAHREAFQAAYLQSNGAARISALEAIAAANGFLLDHLPDRFCADDPHFDPDAHVWRVPVILAYLRIGSVGEVGEIVVNAIFDEVLSHTPFDEMKARGLSLYEQNREKINAAFLSARDA